MENLKDKVYKDLQKKIITQEIKQGTKIKEKELLEKYSIGRTPLREIFIQLKADCLIETIPQSGTYVKKLDLRELKEILEIRLPLEKLAAKMVPYNISKEQVNKMNFLLLNLIENESKLTIDEVKNHTDQIHNIYYEGTGNKKLTQTLIEIHNFCAMAWYSQGYKVKSYQETITSWEKRISMIEAKEIKKLQKYVNKQIVDFANILKLECLQS